MNISALLKSEINRLAGKAIRAQTKATRAQVANHRHSIAALKRELAALRQEVVRLRKSDKRVAPAADSADNKPKRFVAKAVKAWRARLGVSAEAIASLLGVTAQTIYNWETETARPRPAQITKLASIRALGTRELKARIAESRAARKAVSPDKKGKKRSAAKSRA